MYIYVGEWVCLVVCLLLFGCFEFSISFDCFICSRPKSSVSSFTSAISFIIFGVAEGGISIDVM